MSRMRCSRRSGVILYSFANGCFAAYTSPPPAAEPLLKEKPFGESTFQLSPIAVKRFRSYSMRSPWHADFNRRRACAARPRGKAGSERRKACFHPGGSGFHLPRGRVARATSSFIPAAFPSTAQVLCFFLDSRKKRTLRRNKKRPPVR